MVLAAGSGDRGLLTSAIDYQAMVLRPGPTPAPARPPTRPARAGGAPHRGRGRAGRGRIGRPRWRGWLTGADPNVSPGGAPDTWARDPGRWARTRSRRRAAAPGS